MFFELLATLIAGLAGGGVAMALVRLSKGRLPRWLVPIGAGAAMLATTISSEYSWYANTRDALPEDFVVVSTGQNRALYRPWTFASAFTDRFVALDRAAMRTNAENPALRRVDLYLYGRWAPVQAVEVMVDCAGGRRADPGEGALDAPTWRDVGPSDPILRAACAGGEAREG